MAAKKNTNVTKTDTNTTTELAKLKAETAKLRAENEKLRSLVASIPGTSRDPILPYSDFSKASSNPVNPAHKGHIGRKKLMALECRQEVARMIHDDYTCQEICSKLGVKQPLVSAVGSDIGKKARKASETNKPSAEDVKLICATFDTLTKKNGKRAKVKDVNRLVMLSAFQAGSEWVHGETVVTEVLKAERPRSK